MTVQWCNRYELKDVATRNILAANSVLDIGCGLRPQAIIQPHIHICCEPFSEYAQQLANQCANLRHMFVIQNTALNLLEQLPDQSVDTIFMIDVLEHIDKQQGVVILDNCGRVARQQIVIFTPLGFLEQEYEHGEEDSWGFKGGSWQKHRSGWLPEDFSEEWNVYACKDYHLKNGKGEALDPPAGALWAIKTIKPIVNDSSKKFSRNFTNKVGVFSLNLPPSPGANANRVTEFIKDVNPVSYTLLSTENSNYHNDNLQTHDIATYHHIQSPTAEELSQSWLVRIFRNEAFRNLAYKLSIFSMAQQQYTHQVEQIIKDENIKVLLLMSFSTHMLLGLYRASRKRKIRLFVYVESNQQWDRNRYVNLIRKFIYRRVEVVLVGNEADSLYLQELVQ